MNIPRRALGFVYKRCSAPADGYVKLTAFMDVASQNHDSKRAFPVLVDVAEKMSGKNFELVFQPFPMPHNRNAHAVTKLMHVVDKSTKGKGVYPFIANVYDSIELLETTAVKDKSDNDILEILVPMAALVTDMSIEKTTEMFNQRSYDMAARLDFKYCCTRGVYASPTFMLNDVVVVTDPTWKLQDWISAIDTLL